MKIEKKHVAPVLTLAVICLIVAAALAVVNLETKDVIDKNARDAERKSLMEVLPGASDFETVEFSDPWSSDRSEIKAVYRDTGGTGYAVIVATSSSYTSGDPMTFTLGIGSDGRITGVSVTAYSETRNIRGVFTDSFVGKGRDDVSGVELVSGATYSSSAFRTAVEHAFAVLSESGFYNDGGQGK